MRQSGRTNRLRLISRIQHPPPRLGDPHPRDLDRASAAADNYVLAVRSREPSAHKVDYLPDRKAMRARNIASVAPFV
jgi:hypothetical protein